jgi:hypothetical protein
MKTLPQEILDIICEYADVKCRNGMYIGQISKTDPRRNLLRNIAKIGVFENKNTQLKYYWVHLPLCIIEYFPEEFNRIHKPYRAYKYSHYYYSFGILSLDYRAAETYLINLSGQLAY